jgi:PLD-like domain
MPDPQEHVFDIIQRHGALFDSVETVFVEPACDFVNGQPDWNHPFIRVIARQPEVIRPQLPSSIENIPVRIEAATMEEQAARVLALRRAGVAATPGLLASEWRTGFFTSETEAPRNYGRLTYAPFDPTRLAPVLEPMKLIIHVSPDQGWSCLRDFLIPAQQWRIAMFDFTARHIYDQLCAAAQSAGATLSLCLDRGQSGTESSRPTGISEDLIVDGLRSQLGNGFQFAWASVGLRRQFASAYHIKVAVRDDSAIWLSSGNWQSSNQPNREFPTDPAALTPTVARELAKTNREWHVIAESPALARIFGDYIAKDRETSEMDSVPEAPIIGEEPFPSDDEFTMEFRVPPSPLMGELEAPRLARAAFPALVLEKGAPVSVQPILTPDNYAEHALDLIRRATNRLWFQNQSLVVPRAAAPKYRELLDTLRTKCHEIADARVIVRDLIRPQTLDVLRLLKRDGFPMDKVRVMKTCHTKGILVDSRWTLMGSHNWTNEGVLYNRDASLLFDDTRITQYFEQVLDHDWRYVAEHIDADQTQPSAILPLPGEHVEGESLVIDPRLGRAGE